MQYKSQNLAMIVHQAEIGDLAITKNYYLRNEKNWYNIRNRFKIFGCTLKRWITSHAQTYNQISVYTSYKYG